jgi:hypothetical protein
MDEHLQFLLANIESWDDTINDALGYFLNAAFLECGRENASPELKAAEKVLREAIGGVLRAIKHG